MFGDTSRSTLTNKKIFPCESDHGIRKEQKRRRSWFHWPVQGIANNEDYGLVTWD